MHQGPKEAPCMFAQSQNYPPVHQTKKLSGAMQQGFFFERSATASVFNLIVFISYNQSYYFRILNKLRFTKKT
jgi:hypothetical protein